MMRTPDRPHGPRSGGTDPRPGEDTSRGGQKSPIGDPGGMQPTEPQPGKPEKREPGQPDPPVRDPGPPPGQPVREPGQPGKPVQAETLRHAKTRRED